MGASRGSIVFSTRSLYELSQVIEFVGPVVTTSSNVTHLQVLDTVMLKSSSHITSRIAQAFEEAVQSGDLLFFPSTVQEYQEASVQFEIRLCPALEHKSKSSAPQPEKSTTDILKEPDPFAPPYVPKLLIGELEAHDEKFVVLLNKYSVIQKHFLLATKEYKPQTSPLLPAELLQTYLLLLAAQVAGQNYFAFYNCGQLSGASQPHKHVQFLPVDNVSPLERLAKSQAIEKEDDPFTIDALPYANFSYRLSPSLTQGTSELILDTLSQAFLQLLDLCIAVMRQNPNLPVGPPSYNFILTLEHMHLIPRSKAEYPLSKLGSSLSVNSVGFAGMLLVKNELELNALIEEGVLKILAGVGLPKLELSSEELNDV